jgi:NADH dehydrogenase
MSSINAGANAPKILIVGGGYAGFYTAFKLEKLLKKGEAEVL